MKMKKTALALFSLVLLVSAPALAQQNENQTHNYNKNQKKYKHVKEKTITKSYSADNNQLEIDNSFGNVKFITASGNDIKVNVHIEVSSDNEEHAQTMFDRISVTDKQQGNQISFKTTMKDNNKGKNDKNCKDCKSNMRIDYEVQLPATVPLQVSNSFGNIELPDYRGAVSLENKFGQLKTGNLQEVKKLNVEFGEANLGQLSNLKAVFKFSDVKIENLSGNNTIKMEFCGSSKIGLAGNLQSLDLNESYSTVNLRPASNLSASYDLKTSFGSVKDRANIGITRTDKPDKYGPDSNKQYSGKSGSGSAKITVKSSFGDIIVGEPAPGDMDKKQGKTKSKNKAPKEI